MAADRRVVEQVGRVDDLRVAADGADLARAIGPGAGRGQPEYGRADSGFGAPGPGQAPRGVEAERDRDLVGGRPGRDVGLPDAPPGEQRRVPAVVRRLEQSGPAERSRERSDRQVAIEG